MNIIRYGKPYTDEFAIISLTSWTKRINTCGITIYNLYKTCPHFHIVLVLAEEEFPNRLNSLPYDLRLMIDKGIFECLFIEKNYKAFKKCLFTMQTYTNIPIITADDDMIYTTNYALELYQEHIKHPNNIISYRKSSYANHISGPCTLFPPSVFSMFVTNFTNSPPTNILLDDGWFDDLIGKNHLTVLSLHSFYPCKVHDEIAPLSGGIEHHPEWKLTHI